MKYGRLRGWSRRLNAALMAAVLVCGMVPVSEAKQVTENGTPVAAENQASSVLADWKFEERYSTGSISDATLTIQDQSGNHNDLEMQVYVNSQPTEHTGAVDWSQYLSFSNDSMTGDAGSMVFDGDNGSVKHKTGADLITVQNAPINQESFRDGYTIEYIYYFPEDWTTADKWMSMMARQGDSSSIGEPEQGTMFTSVSNCKEIQFNAAPADDDYEMEDSSWSVTMDQGGVWYHIAVVSDNHKIRTFVNGCEAFRDNVSDEMVGLYADPDDGRFRIGSSWWKEDGQTLDKFLQGSLQEIRISGAPLTQENWLIPNPTDYLDEFGSNEPYVLKHPDNYNFVLLPDTQNTIEYCPEVMYTALDELADSADELNIEAVIHLGDIVDDVEDTQYEHAREAFYRLPEQGIKLMMQPGNHDGASGSVNCLNSFSGQSKAWTSRSDWYSHFSPNGEQNSSYMFVRAGSYNYLVISMAAQGGGKTRWHSEDEEWLRSVLEQYPNCPTIIATHNMQSCSETAPSAIKLSNDGQRIWEIAEDYDQVFMLAGGHHHGSGTEVLTNANGKPVLSVLTDYQFGYNGGNGWFRYLEFDETDNKIYYSAYSPYAASLDEEEKSFFDVNFLVGDSGNQGELDLNFKERFAGMEVPASQTSTEGKWMSGEYHTHTGQSKDATENFMTLDNVLGTAFRDQKVLEENKGTSTKTDNIVAGDGFDYLMLADHLRKSYSKTDGKAEHYDTPLYKAIQAQTRAWEEKQVNGDYTDKILYSGFEWDMPGLDHAAVGLIGADDRVIPYQGIHQFEWLYGSQSDGDDTELFDEQPFTGDGYNESANWGERKNPNGSKGDMNTAVDAVEWVAEHYPNSFILPNHPSRHNGGNGEVTLEALRKLNDAAPEVVFGFEGMPGNQMDPSCELPDDDIRANADEMISVTGGVWDAMLSEGRRFYNFANSDFHFKISSNENYSSGYWPSEFSSNNTWVEPGEDGRFTFSDVVNGMRSGNSYAVKGNLISDLQFTVSANGGEAGMGQNLNVEEGTPVTVTIRFKVPETNNYATLYGTDTGSSVSNTPELDHLDLIMGHVTGKVSTGAYNSTDNTDAKIVRTFTKEELAAAKGKDGFYTLTYTTPADSNMYFRVRGLSNSDVDENGDPVTHQRSIPDEKPAKFDYINDYNYSHLSFYANPIWVDTYAGSSSGSHTSTTYKITCERAENGSVSTKAMRAEKNSVVTLNVQPADGYELDTLQVVDGSGTAVELSNKDGVYTFVMPGSDVTVRAEFRKAYKPLSFTDVNTGDYFYEPVLWAVNHGIAAGTSANTFSPEAPCTRAEAVTMLWKASGAPAANGAKNPFTDVKEDAFYYDAVLWAVENGVTAGTSAETFSPNLVCTRGQIITLLWNFAGAPAPAAGAQRFLDVKDSDFFAQAAAWGIQNGITSGTGANCFSPMEDCLRSQVVTFLFRSQTK